jgi:flagellar export protein FliJ
MKPFRFRLNAVLRFREQRATETGTRFARAMQAQQLAETARQGTEQDCARFQLERRETAQSGGPAGAFEQQRRSAIRLQAELDRRTTVHKEARASTAQAREQMLAARRACEVLERLRERQRDAHGLAESRAEQAQLDELATQRHSRRHL